MDAPSILQDSTNLNSRIAQRVRQLRAGKKLSLAALAAKSDVSRSMISLIERGETSPTAVVLEKLAAALGVTLASLFDVPDATSKAQSGPVALHADQPQWQDPASGYLRRNVTPAGVRHPMQMVEVHFPPRGRVAFESGARDARVYQQIWVLQGTIHITLGKDFYSLSKGDCLAMELDRPTMFYNPTHKTTRYVVVTVSEPWSKP